MSSGSLLRSDDAGAGSGASGPRETYCKCLEPIASLTLKRGTSLLQFPVRPRRDPGQVQPSLEEPFSPTAKVLREGKELLFPKRREGGAEDSTPSLKDTEQET